MWPFFFPPLALTSPHALSHTAVLFSGPMGVNHFKISVLEETKYELGGRTFDW